MSREGPRPGEIYLVEFPEHHPSGHEQHGVRPAMVLAIPQKARFPVIWMLPITTDRGQSWAKSSPSIYIHLPKGTGGLPAGSILLLDQLRSLDAKRVKRFVGIVPRNLFEDVKVKCLELINKS